MVIQFASLLSPLFRKGSKAKSKFRVSMAEMLLIFDKDFYEMKTGDKWSSKSQALVDFLEKGYDLGHDPHPLFSCRFYLENYPDVEKSGMNPFYHFAKYGHKEGRDPHPMFALQWYLISYPEVAASGVNPLIHYLEIGSAKGFKPNPDFDPSWYKQSYSEEIPEGMDPLVHFVIYGKKSGFYRSKNHEKAVILSSIQGKKFSCICSVQGHTRERELLPYKAFPIKQSDLERIDLLSLDVWDTVLRRDCFPDEIKLQTSRFVYLTCREYLRPAFNSSLALLRRRIQAENESAPKNDYEYRFSTALMQWLKSVLNPSCPEKIILQLRDKILAHEFNAERRSIRIDSSFRDFLEKTKLPTTIFASDFYLESPIIRRLLESAGVGDVFVRGYSSCDDYLNKRSGQLFDKILENFSVSPDAVLHVGDNIQSDFEVPQKKGIACVHYSQPPELQKRESMETAYNEYLKENPSIHQDYLSSSLEELISKGDLQNDFTELQKIGLRISPLATGFVFHILEKALYFKVKDIYFFTREGQFFKDLYEHMVSFDPYNLGIDSYPLAHVLEVSRVSTFAGSLTSLDNSELMRMWSQYSKQSLRGFCKSLDFDVNIIKPTADKYMLDLDEVVAMPWADPRFTSIIYSPEIKKQLASHLKKRRKTLKAYLSQQGLCDDSTVVVVVDIGWRGSIQDNICRVLDKHVHGCYLGLFRFLNVQPSNSSKDGWVADYNVGDFCWDGDYIAPLEMLFNALGGSVVGYQESEDGVHALRNCILGEDAIIEKYILSVQEGIFRGCQTVCDYVRLHGLVSDDLRDLARSTAQRYLDCPSPVIVKAFYELEHNEFFGTGEVVDMNLMSKLLDRYDSLSSHALHAAAQDVLDKGYWKAGVAELHRSFYSSLQIQEKNSLPLELTAHFHPPLIGRYSLTPRFAVYSPSPILGSGGHRTIFNIARRVHKLGFELYIYLEDEGCGVAAVDDYLQGTPANVFVGWRRSIAADFSLATIAHSAAFVSELDSPYKGYLVQDFEASFNPLSDQYVISENSYCCGLHHFTIGNWLTHVLRTQYSARTVPAGLGVDTETYKLLPEIAREDAVCFLYQPDKPRRTPWLGIKALRLLKKARPDVKIYVYGSDIPLDCADLGIVNLGFINDLKKINELYNRCKVGLCISLSNPSRIPYEMMAAGMVPVDLYRYNNLLDHENGTAVLAYQGEASLAKAMLDLLEDSSKFDKRASACVANAKTRTLQWEQDTISNWIAHIMAQGDFPNSHQFSPYSDKPVIANEDESDFSLSFCQWQLKMASS